jgi:hypothetical protein
MDEEGGRRRAHRVRVSFMSSRVRQRHGCEHLLTIPEGLRLEPHEVATGRVRAEYGFRVQFRVPVFGDHMKNPDAFIDGELWEFKAPKGSSEKNTIADQFKRAGKQAKNLVLDLRRCDLPDDVSIDQAQWRFHGQTKLIRLIVIDHLENLTRHEHTGML